jgi:GH15 family glucan-1,4-alpha-glucosidase
VKVTQSTRRSIAKASTDHATEDTFPPISDYGLIGNGHTAALVSSNGSIDWLCLPRFDSPSLFARILDLERGGNWQICPEGSFTSAHRYLDDTNILETTFTSATGQVVLTDFMAVSGHDSEVSQAAPGQLIRIVRGLAGTVNLISRCTPRPDYGRATVELVPAGTAIAFDPFWLTGPADWQLDPATAACACYFTLAAGETVAFVLSTTEHTGQLPPEPATALASTTQFWRRWAQQCTYQGPYRDAVVRSALALQLMTYTPTGAFVAAPTTSLPEAIGGSLNWDYRMSWIRDSTFTLYALLLAGYLDDEWPFFDWLARTVKLEGTGLKILYPITHEGQTKEQTLPHLSGYRHSPPVRIGNQAVQQVQLDVYGEVLSALHFAWRVDRYNPIEIWPQVQPMLDWVAAHWCNPDSGIWEIRGEPKHYVYSQAMLWVALKNGVEIAETMALPGDLKHWRDVRDQIRAEVMAKGWSEKLGAFKQSYEDETLDAANLRLPVVGFIAGDDPKMVSTIEATMRQLVSNGLCYRYSQRFVPGGEEGTFILCSFWLINALILAGRTEEAQVWFEQMLAKSSPLGLFAEEMVPDSGLHLGNFPQAFSHVGVIHTAVSLAHANQVGQVQEHHAKAADKTGHNKPAKRRDR